MVLERRELRGLTGCEQATLWGRELFSKDTQVPAQLVQVSNWIELRSSSQGMCVYPVSKAAAPVGNSWGGKMGSVDPGKDLHEV